MAHIFDLARKSHGAFGAWVQSVTVERFPGGAAVRGEGVGVEYTPSPRQRLKPPLSSSGGALLVVGLERRAGPVCMEKGFRTLPVNSTQAVATVAVRIWFGSHA